MGCKASKPMAVVEHGDELAPVALNQTTSGSETSSDVVTEVKKDIEGCSDLMKKIVRMETLYGTPIEDIYEGVHDGFILGEGAGGVVRRIRHRTTGTDFAVKCLKKDRATEAKGLERLRNEIVLMSELSHPNIVRIEEVYESPNNIFIVQELCTGGDLFDRLEKLSDYHYTEAQCAKLVQQILGAVCYLHKNGITHRDLKLENFMFSSWDADSELRMIDFGLSKHFENGQHLHDQGVGTRYTVAPEVLSGDYTEKADLWSVGVVTFLLLSGESPFGGDCLSDDVKEVTQKIVNADFTFEPDNVWEGVSQAGKTFVKRLLNPDPNLRPSAKQVQKDPWLLNWANKNTHYKGNQLKRATVEALVAFKESSEVQRLLSEVLSFTLFPEQIADLRKEFEKIDKDGDGEICFMAFKQVLKETVDARTLEEIFDCVKTRKAAPTLRYHEFLAAVLSQIHLDDRNMRLAFDRLDSKRKGFLTVDDLLDVLGDSVDCDEFKRIWNCSAKTYNSHPYRITLFDFKNLIRGQAIEAISPISEKPVIELTEVAALSVALSRATKTARQEGSLLSAADPCVPVKPQHLCDTKNKILRGDTKETRHSRRSLQKLAEMRLAVLEASEIFDRELSNERSSLIAKRGSGTIPGGASPGADGRFERRRNRHRRKTVSSVAGMIGA